MESINITQYLNIICKLLPEFSWKVWDNSLKTINVDNNLILLDFSTNIEDSCFYSNNLNKVISYKCLLVVSMDENLKNMMAAAYELLQNKSSIIFFETLEDLLLFLIESQILKGKITEDLDTKKFIKKSNILIILQDGEHIKFCPSQDSSDLVILDQYNRIGSLDINILKNFEDAYIWPKMPSSEIVTRIPVKLYDLDKYYLFSSEAEKESESIELEAEIENPDVELEMKKNQEEKPLYQPEGQIPKSKTELDYKYIFPFAYYDFQKQEFKVEINRDVLKVAQDNQKQDEILYIDLYKKDDPPLYHKNAIELLSIPDVWLKITIKDLNIKDLKLENLKDYIFKIYTQKDTNIAPLFEREIFGANPTLNIKLQEKIRDAIIDLSYSKIFFPDLCCVDQSYEPELCVEADKKEKRFSILSHKSKITVPRSRKYRISIKYKEQELAGASEKGEEKKIWELFVECMIGLWESFLKKTKNNKIIVSLGIGIFLLTIITLCNRNSIKEMYLSIENFKISSPKDKSIIVEGAVFCSEIKDAISLPILDFDKSKIFIKLQHPTQNFYDPLILDDNKKFQKEFMINSSETPYIITIYYDNKLVKREEYVEKTKPVLKIKDIYHNIVNKTITVQLSSIPLKAIIAYRILLEKEGKLVSDQKSKNSGNFYHEFKLQEPFAGQYFISIYQGNVLKAQSQYIINHKLDTVPISPRLKEIQNSILRDIVLLTPIVNQLLNKKISEATDRFIERVLSNCKKNISLLKVPDDNAILSFKKNQEVCENLSRLAFLMDALLNYFKLIRKENDEIKNDIPKLSEFVKKSHPSLDNKSEIEIRTELNQLVNLLKDWVSTNRANFSDEGTCSQIFFTNIEQFLKSWEENHQWIEMRCKIEFFMKNKAWRQAIDEGEKGVKKFSEDFFLYCWLALAYAEIENSVKATANYKEYVRILKQQNKSDILNRAKDILEDRLKREDSQQKKEILKQFLEIMNKSINKK